MGKNKNKGKHYFNSNKGNKQPVPNNQVKPQVQKQKEVDQSDLNPRIKEFSQKLERINSYTKEPLGIVRKLEVTPYNRNTFRVIKTDFKNIFLGFNPTRTILENKLTYEIEIWLEIELKKCIMFFEENKK
jgi:hypothetical protein